jgi:hypothetical protein
MFVRYLSRRLMSELTSASTSPVAWGLRTLEGGQRGNDLGATLTCPWKERGIAAGEQGVSCSCLLFCVLWLCFVLWPTCVILPIL